MSDLDEAEGVFVANRPLLFSIAYEILGSASDAEDAIHDAYLRWRAVDFASVDNPRAYLAQVVARQAMSVLRSARRRREEYVGPWLPEPLETDQQVPLDHVLTGEAVTTAMLLILESLSPSQRVVFVLREVFAFEYAEIARTVGKSESAVRQINHRARTSVHARRRVAMATPKGAKEVADTFVRAAATGDMASLIRVLDPDVVFTADGGGVVSAARRPVRGQDKVARFVAGMFAKADGMEWVTTRMGEYNGMPTLLVSVGGVLDQVISVEVRANLITAVYCVRNPSKLARSGQQGLESEGPHT